MKTLSISFLLVLFVGLTNAHIYIAFSTLGRFIRLPSTRNKELLEFKNKMHELEMDTVAKIKKKELELFLLFEKNNGRQIDFRYVNCDKNIEKNIDITEDSLENLRLLKENNNFGSN